MQVIEDDFPLVQDGLLVGYSNNAGNETEKVVKESNEIKQVISEKKEAHENDKNTSELSKSCSTRSWQDGVATRLYEQNGSIDTHANDKKQSNTLEITENSKSTSSLAILAPQRIFCEENKDNSNVAEVNASIASPCICKGKKADDAIEDLRKDKEVAAIFENNDFEMIESIKSEEKIEEILNVIDPCDETYESYMIDTDDMNYCYERMLQINSKFENTSERVYEGKDRVNKVLEALNLDEENSHDEIINLIKEYEDVFHLKGEKLGTTDVIEHAIYTKDNAPVNAKPYRFPHALKCELERQIMEMWEAGTIEPSGSPYRSNIFLVPKPADKNGKKRYRLVEDFRALNEKTIPDRYPLPNILDIIDQVGGAKYFSTLDLSNGFYQVLLKEEDRHKTAFSTEFGLFHFKKLPMGCSNAPATFQRAMDNAFRGMQQKEIFLCLDDAVIYGKTIEEHNDKLKRFFERARKHNLKLQPEKCVFCKEEVLYLGHILNGGGVKCDPKKLDAIKKFPTPKTVKNVRQFLGLAGNSTDPNSRVSRYQFKLSNYDFSIQYKQGTTNVVADCLSRNPIIESVNIVETRSRTIKTKPVNYKLTRTRNTKPKQLSEDKTSDVNDKEDKAVEVERGVAGQAITEPKQSMTDKEMTASEIVNTESNTTLDPIIEYDTSFKCEKSLIECREKLHMRKDNYLIFVSSSGKPLDDGARQLQARNILPKFIFGQPGEVSVHRRGKNFKFGITLRGDRLESTPTIMSSMQDGIKTLKHLLIKYNLESLSIAKTTTIEHAQWEFLKNLIKK
ncbi:hypothetical protein TKK_0013856 [Trichogramma kaykai]